MRAAASVARMSAADAAFFGLPMIATRRSVGTISPSSSSRFPPSSGYISDVPVMLPPGDARLVTSPAPTGSPGNNITIGIVVVAFWRASASRVPGAMITSTRSPTSSAATTGRRSILPSAHRRSIVRFRPSLYPRSRRPSRNGSKAGLGAPGGRAGPSASHPIRHTFSAGCAGAEIGRAITAPPSRLIASRRLI